MKTGIQGPTKEYWVKWSPKSYRFKEDALVSHAPASPGLYEVVTFPDGQTSQIVYIGLALDGTIQEKLAGHFKGDNPSITTELRRVPPVIYFDFLWQSNAQSPDDLKDIAWWLTQTNQPAFNAPGSVQHSGRYSDIEVVEK